MRVTWQAGFHSFRYCHHLQCQDIGLFNALFAAGKTIGVGSDALSKTVPIPGHALWM